jgi:hypothetical protein
VRDALARELEAARYAADRAFRQYDAADPENRLVAGELEARWNRTLTRVAEVERRLGEHDAATPRRLEAEPISFASLAEDLATVWTAPTTDARLKKRIVRTVIHEAVADLDDATGEIVIVLHWMGGAHTEHRLPRRRRGQRNSTSLDIVAAVHQLVLVARDAEIAGILNRHGLKTGNGNRWTRERVTSMRSSYAIPVYRPAENAIEPWLNLRHAAALVGVAPRTLRIAVERGELDALHPLANGPWIFNRAVLTGPAAERLVLRARGNRRYPTVPNPAQQCLFPSMT